jgi:hypothetical protein
MGLAELPRLYFGGFTYWSPSTMNNNDNQPTYDPASATLNWPWLERHGLQDRDQFDAYVTQPGIVPTADSALDPNIDSGAPPAEWNFYGDNSFGFVQEDEPVIEWPDTFSKPSGGLSVTGYTDAGGTHVADGDPWIGEPIRLNVGLDPPKLVDVDPICPWSSQLFVDALSIGAADGERGLTAATAGRAHSRWVFFGRNLNRSGDVIIAGVASAMWQLGLPADAISFLDHSPSPDSLAGQLKAAVAAPGIRGLMVRYVTYHTVYFQGSAFTVRGAPDWKAISKIYAEYAAALVSYEQGKLTTAPSRPANRAYSNTVGWLAPWSEYDMRSMAAGRVLHGAAHVKPLDPTLTPHPGVGPAVMEYAIDPADPTMVSRVSLDLGSTIPERDSSLTKVDFGTMQLALAPDGEHATATPFAEIPYAGGYDAGAYVATAGVVDLAAADLLHPLTVAELQQHMTVSFIDPQTQTVTPALHEADFTAETDDRGVYLNQPGEPWSPADESISVQVRYRGGRPPPGTRLRIAQYSPDPPGFVEGAWRLVSEAAGATAQAPFLSLAADGEVIDGAYVTVRIPHADDGAPYATVTLSVSALRSGPPVLALTPLAPGRGTSPPPSVVHGPAVAQEFFANVRVLPFHNAMAVAFENWLRTGPSVDLASRRTFDAVFRTFVTMYPAMRFIRDPLQFQAWRGRICEVTDPATFETARYMPVTRSLSCGQRRMLVLWNDYANGALPTAVKGESFGRRA